MRWHKPYADRSESDIFLFGGKRHRNIGMELARSDKAERKRLLAML